MLRLFCSTIRERLRVSGNRKQHIVLILELVVSPFFVDNSFVYAVNNILVDYLLLEQLNLFNILRSVNSVSCFYILQLPNSELEIIDFFTFS